MELRALIERRYGQQVNPDKMIKWLDLIVASEVTKELGGDTEIARKLRQINKLLADLSKHLQ